MAKPIVPVGRGVASVPASGGHIPARELARDLDPQQRSTNLQSNPAQIAQRPQDRRHRGNGGAKLKALRIEVAERFT